MSTSALKNEICLAHLLLCLSEMKRHRKFYFLCLLEPRVVVPMPRWAKCNESVSQRLSTTAAFPQNCICPPLLKLAFHLQWNIHRQWNAPEFRLPGILQPSSGRVLILGSWDPHSCWWKDHRQRWSKREGTSREDSLQSDNQRCREFEKKTIACRQRWVYCIIDSREGRQNTFASSRHLGANSNVSQAAGQKVPKRDWLWKRGLLHDGWTCWLSGLPDDGPASRSSSRSAPCGCNSHPDSTSGQHLR